MNGRRNIFTLKLDGIPAHPSTNQVQCQVTPFTECHKSLRHAANLLMANSIDSSQMSFVVFQ